MATEAVAVAAERRAKVVAVVVVAATDNQTVVATLVVELVLEMIPTGRMLMDQTQSSGLQLRLNCVYAGVASLYMRTFEILAANSACHAEEGGFRLSSHRGN